MSRCKTLELEILCSTNDRAIGDRARKLARSRLMALVVSTLKLAWNSV